jgi:tetratricopeptide (TPR) repeat protein
MLNLKFGSHATIIICILNSISAISAVTVATAASQTNTINTTSVQEDERYKNGVDLYNLGKYSAAIGLFDKALTIDPNVKGAIHFKRIALNELNKTK